MACSILFASLVFLFSFPERVEAQFGIKAGTTISNFYYTGDLNPKLEYDIDLRPFLSYDIEFAQLGNQNPLIAPYIVVYMESATITTF